LMIFSPLAISLAKVKLQWCRNDPSLTHLEVGVAYRPIVKR
jgi:hypothetical protein